MRNLTVRYRFKLLGGHVHARVFVGPDGDHLALVGNLVMREEEWALFRNEWGRSVSYVEDEA